MTRQLLHLLALVSLTGSMATLSGCSKHDDLPVVVADRTVCSNCKMLVSETVHATAFKVGDNFQIFDDLGCMLGSLASDPTVKPTKVLAQDQRSGKWIDASTSYYVHSSKYRTPMGFGYVSLETERDALQASRESGGTVIKGLSELMAYHEKEHAHK